MRFGNIVVDIFFILIFFQIDQRQCLLRFGAFSTQLVKLFNERIENISRGNFVLSRFVAILAPFFLGFIYSRRVGEFLF